MILPGFRPLSRRAILKGLTTSTAAAAGSGIFTPYLSRAEDRVLLPQGVQSGDVTATTGVVWARADRPSRLHVEIATSDSFKEILQKVWVDALPESDLTGKVALEGLPPGQEIFYRVTGQNHAEPTILGQPLIGRFRTAPADKRNVSFVWSGDTCGQGWGIDESRGGMKTYATMLAHRPDFFIHNGDTIYADGPIPAEIKLPNGELWKNVTIEEKAKCAETLPEFRANYKYNLLDKNLRAFNAAVPTVAQWDDHEVTNNWWPEEPLTRAEHQRKKYLERNMLVMVARAARAFHEYMPIRPEPSEPARVYRKIAYGPLLDVFMIDMRSYRGPNGENRQTSYGPDAYFLGPTQLAWLKRELKASRATWKVIAADMPIGLYVVYDGDRKFGSEAIAQGDPGAPLGRELEIADILSFIKRERVHNAVWLTADVHYTAAHYYDPDKAKFQDFLPFWEFVSGPIHAGSFGPNELDATFGPQLMFVKAPSKEQGQNLSPAFDLQFFGHVTIDGTTEQMVVTLRDWNNVALWAKTLDPQRS
jgi:alkaline phosphatase D